MSPLRFMQLLWKKMMIQSSKLLSARQNLKCSYQRTETWLKNYESKFINRHNLLDNILRYDQLVLKKFVAEAYAKLVDVDVKRLDVPERAFTGEKHPS